MIRRQSAVSIIFAVFVLLLLSVVTIAVFSLISTDVDTSANDVRSSRAFDIAEGGVQFGVRAVQDDVSAATQTATPTDKGYCTLAYIEGYTAGGSATNSNNAVFHGTDWTNFTISYAAMTWTVNTDLTIRNFEQSVNIIGTRLKTMEIALRAAVNSTGGTSPRIQLQYSITGGPPYTNVGGVITLTSTSYNYYYATIPLPTYPWQYFINNNLIIRALRTNGGSGGNRRQARVDWLALRVTYEVDAQTEPWSSSTFSTAIVLGNGAIMPSPDSTISDECGKININYASPQLLQYLMEYNGIASARASTLAANIVSYRSLHWFKTIEELKQILGNLTNAEYDAIDQDVTVHSWVNDAVRRPDGLRAPVNINTASSNVLRAIFRTASDTADVNSLASAVITQRATNPFTSTFSTYHTQSVTRDNRCFSGFLQNQTLSPSQRNQIMAVIDGSNYNTSLTQDWSDINPPVSTGTELSFFSNAYLIESTGRIAETNDNIDRAVECVYGYTYDYPNYLLNSIITTKLPVYIDQPPEDVHAYWREIRN